MKKRFIGRVVTIVAYFGAIAGLGGMNLLIGCSRTFDKPAAAGVGLVIGTLLDDQDVEITNARIRLLECGLSSLSSSDGTFRIDQVPNGDYTVRIDASLLVEGQPVEYMNQLENQQPVRGAVRDLGDLRLTRSGSLTGVLSASDGTSPLHTVVYLKGGDKIGSVADDGSFTLAHLPPGTWQLGASKPGYQLKHNGSEQVTIAADTQSQVTLVIEPVLEDSKGSVSGLILLANPGPKAGVVAEMTERFGSKVYRVTTDAEGTFQHNDIPAGLYELGCSYPGYQTVGIANLEVRDSEDIVLEQVIILPPDDRTGTQYPWDQDPTGNPDDDQDGVPDKTDNCPIISNPDQQDEDQDGIGNECDQDYVDPNAKSDEDKDGVDQGQDNCPTVPNPEQANHDEDPFGDLCDDDDDNDGLADPVDPCPYLPDPAGDAALCNWPRDLVFSAQIANGDIRIFRAQVKGELLITEIKTGSTGQALGASLAPDGRMFYHYRQTQDEPFRLCMTDTNQAGMQPTCWTDWQFKDGEKADIVNPSVCESQQGLVLFYQREKEQGSRLYYTVVPKDASLMEPGVEVDFTLGENHFPPPRLHNYRYPFCYVDPQMSLRLLYSIDFRDYSDDMTLDWSCYDATYFDGPSSTMPIPSQAITTPATHERRPIRISEALTKLSWYWFDSSIGDKTDIVRVSGTDSMTIDTIVTNGSHNLDPAVLDLQNGNALLAYQSDIAGSFDIYVMSINTGSVVRITNTNGWAGNPAWVP